MFARCAQLPWWSSHGGVCLDALTRVCHVLVLDEIDRRLLLLPAELPADQTVVIPVPLSMVVSLFQRCPGTIFTAATVAVTGPLSMVAALSRQCSGTASAAATVAATGQLSMVVALSVAGEAQPLPAPVAPMTGVRNVAHRRTFLGLVKYSEAH